MWVNVKVPKKRKENAFMGEVKTFQPKTTVATPTSSTPDLSRTVWLNKNTKVIVATQAFVEDQTPSLF